MNGEGPEDAVGAATRAFFWLCVALVGGFLAWAGIGTLEVVSTAMGEVIPSTQLKSVQHLEGGIVREIHVAEGDRVEAGQPLVSLEPTSTGADVGELTARLASLKADIVRLEAEAAGATQIAFPADFAADHPGAVREARSLFDARRARIEGQIAQSQETVAQREQQVREISARLGNTRDKLKHLNEQVKISEELLKDDLTNRMVHLNLLKEQSGLRSSVAEDEAALPRLQASIREARQQMENIRTGFHEEVHGDLEKKRRDLEELSARFRKFEDSLTRTVLRAPVAGLVKTLYVATLGGVVKAGGSVVDLVPEGDRLVIEAKLPVQDVGYVHPGQTAVVRLASADAVRLGDIEGKVVQVSPDAFQQEKGGAYYRVRIETGRDYFERKQLRYSLVPGVQVQCNIRIGQRTVMEYLLEPFLGTYHMALRER
ncbi:MAG: HlyD family type I secretion periplasmic adaptor subunit [Magnetospirillum sp. WYHS-4]